MSLDDKISYSLYLSSENKINSSKNYSAQFNINWDTFLPRKYDKYKIRWAFKSQGGYYYDSIAGGTNYSVGKVYIDFGGSSYSYDTANDGASQFVGIIERVIEATSVITSGGISNNTSTFATLSSVSTDYNRTGANFFKASYVDNIPKTIARPSQNVITVKLTNYYNNGVLLNTSSGGTVQGDMTNWTMEIEFIPIEPEKNANIDNRPNF